VCQASRWRAAPQEFESPPRRFLHFLSDSEEDLEARKICDFVASSNLLNEMKKFEGEKKLCFFYFERSEKN